MEGRLSIPFCKKIYLNKKNEIEDIVKQSQEIIDLKALNCLVTLAKLMDYEPVRDEIFSAVPTLLPFSPTKQPTFYFSIVSTLFNNAPNQILNISIHEISHFLFFDILD